MPSYLQKLKVTISAPLLLGLTCLLFHYLSSNAESAPIIFTLSLDGAYNASLALHELITVHDACDSTCEGADNVHYTMLKHLSHEAVLYLLASYNKIWTEGVCPPD